tara:strand:- start:331 stop:960 length:630 start_codon:yes stop_codon:yes gene_type:complete
MNVLIDASNIVPDSVGFTHLKELLKNHKAKEKKICLQDRLILIIKNYLLNLLYRFSILRSDGVILLSKYSKKFLGKKKLNLKLSLMVYKKKFFREFKKNIDKKFKILYVSLTLFGLDREKNLLNSNLYKFIKKVNLKFKNLIIIKNFKNHKNLINIYPKFDLQVYPSKCEAFGLIILETIASSLPIICSNYPIYKEILKRNTIYFDPEN